MEDWQRYQTEWRGENGDRRTPPLGGIILGLTVSGLMAAVGLGIWWVLALMAALASAGL